MPIIQSSYKPQAWCRNTHIQTLWPSLFRSRVSLNITQERVELDDGDFIDIAWSGPEKAPIVLFLHGLEGSIKSPYAKGVMLQLNKQGFRACFMHLRGCSDKPNRLPIAYHSGKTDDPATIAQHIKSKYGEQLFGVMGVSLGGNIALKWLGEMSDRCTMQRAAVMSVPFTLNDAALRLRGGFSRLYEKYLIKSLHKSYQHKFSQIKSPLNLDVKTLKTFRDFDNDVTAPLHGFKDVDDYYQQSSSLQYLKRIAIPTLIVHAKDDPFMFPTTAPLESDLSDQVFLELTEHGGHVGFIEGKNPLKMNYWGEHRLAEWMAEGL